MKKLFNYFTEEQRETTPSFDITADLNSLIENEWKKETRSRFSRAAKWIGSAAAVLVLSFGIYQYMDKPEPAIKDTYNDPQAGLHRNQTCIAAGFPDDEQEYSQPEIPVESG